MQVIWDPIVESQDELEIKTQPCLSRAQYRAFCEANPDLRVERSAEGVVTVMAPAHTRSGARNFYLAMELGNWARKDGTGVGFDSSAGFDLPNGSNRSPDVSWVLKSRIDALSADQREGYWEICPDFVAEIRSSTDRLITLQNKMNEYISCGAQLGWLIDPLERRVWVYRPGVPVERLDDPDTITAGPLMPGFVLNLSTIWEPTT